MAQSGRQPDMVVGIDFGMTCTGVAWSMGPEWPEPKTLQHWPGKLGHELRNKVDTAISYDAATGELAQWGFLCNPDDEKSEYNELFKLYLDPNYQDPTGHAPTLLEARTWFRDYMSCLRTYLLQYFSDSLPRFERKRVEYVFSVPTTWKDPAMIAEMEKQIQAAGFGQSPELERASIYLTEAEAAAVFTSKQSMDAGDVFLVCDIGGGTTDLNVLKVESAHVGNIVLSPLSWTEGMAVGSTIIDFKAQQMIQDRLERVRPRIHEDIEMLSGRMIHDSFATFKCSFGNSAFHAVDLHMPIPEVPSGLSFPDAGIEDSKLVMKSDELKAIFEEQITKLFGLIDQQLQIIQSRNPHEKISYLILSGGLGSSPYVQQRVRACYEKGANSKFRNTKTMKILTAGEPQLAVVHGLVMARTQACRGGREFLSKRCSPMSYGIVSRELYDPAKHQGQKVVVDERDGRKWAVDQVNWIVKRGQILSSTTGIAQRYSMKLSLGELAHPWKIRIASSAAPAELLPRSMTTSTAATAAAPVTIICEVEFALDPRHFRVRNRHWYQPKRPYHVGEFDVRLLVGTGLRFEIWSATAAAGGAPGSEEKCLSRGHEEVRVDWKSVAELEAPGRDAGGRMERVG